MGVDIRTERILIQHPELIDVEIEFWSNMFHPKHEHVCYLRCLKDTLECDVECEDVSD